MQAHTPRSITKLPFKELYHFELIHAAKAGLAALLGYACYQLLPHTGITAQWILITILVVMASNSALGTQISRAWYRILATLSGSALAIGVLLLPDQALIAPLALLLITLLLVFVAVSFSKYSYAATLGAITFCMITFASTPQLSLAVHRTVEILLGILISLLVSAFVYPIRSKKMIAQMSRINLKRVAMLYQAMLIEHRDRFSEPDLMRLDAKILESNTAQRQLLAHIKFEQRNHRPSGEHCKRLIRSEIAFYRYGAVLEVLHRTLLENQQKNCTLMEMSHAFIDILIQFLDETASGRSAQTPILLHAMEQCHQSLEHHIEQLPGAPSDAPAFTLYFIQTRLQRVSEHLLEHYAAL